MLLKAAFNFFSSFSITRRNIIYKLFSPIHLFLLFHLFHSLFISLFCQISFNAYIRNLPHYTIKYNKKSGDFKANPHHP